MSNKIEFKGIVWSVMDQCADYIPLVSIITNLVDQLVMKCFAEKRLQGSISSNVIIIEHYWTHIKNKSIYRSLVVCIPIVGNFILIALDIIKGMQYCQIRNDPSLLQSKDTAFQRNFLFSNPKNIEDYKNHLNEELKKEFFPDKDINSVLPQPPHINLPQSEKVKIDEESINKILLNTDLHAPHIFQTSTNEESNLIGFNIDNDNLKEEYFWLFACDFMGLNGDGYKPHPSKSLFFVIKQLESFKNEDKLFDKKISEKELESINLLIDQLKDCLYISQQITNLDKKKSISNYPTQRHQIKKSILSILEKKESILLCSGYNGEKGGHNINIELKLCKDTLPQAVEAFVYNTGEGANYHNSNANEKRKIEVFALSPIKLEDLEKSLFLEQIIDMQQTDLLDNQIESIKMKNNTEFCIHDFYGGLINQWRGEKQPATNVFYSEQSGGSCSWMPFRRKLRELLSQDVYPVANIYIEWQAFQLLLQNQKINNLDLARIWEALEQFNRHALKLERKNKLPKELKNRIIDSTKILNEALNRNKYKNHLEINNHKIHIPDCKDQGNYNFKIPQGLSFNHENSIQSDPFRFKKIPTTVTPEQCVDYIKQAHEIIMEAFNNNQLAYAAELSRTVITAIPNPDNLFWKKQIDQTPILQLTEIAGIIWYASTRLQGAMELSVKDNLMFLKIFSITTKVSVFKGKLDKKIIEKYASQIKFILNKFKNYFQVTHPDYVALIQSCDQALESYVPSKPSEFEIEKATIYIKKKKYDTVEMMKKEEPEFILANRLYQENKKSLMNLPYPHCQFISWGEEEIGATAGMLSHTSFFDKVVSPPKSLRNDSTPDNVSFFLRGEQWKPLQEFICLRDLHHFVLMTTTLKGQIISYYGRTLEMRYGHYGDCSGGNGRKEQVYEKLNNFEGDRTDTPFLYTFNHFNEHEEKKLPNIIDPTTTTQNEQIFILNNSGMEEEKFESINTYDELKIPQLINYFRCYFIRLKEPKYQAYFAHFLFSWAKNKKELVIQKVMNDSLKGKEILFNFLNSALKTTKKLQWDQVHYFFLRILVQAACYLAFSGKSKGLLKKQIKIINNIIRSFVENDKLIDEKRVEALITIISCVPYFDHYLFEESIQLCKRAKQIFDEKGYTTKNEHNLETQKDFSRGQYLLGCDIEPKGLLPFSIINHKDYPFKRNFPAKIVGEGLYEFNDEHHQIYRIQSQGKELGIYRLYQNQWFQLANDKMELIFKSCLDHPCKDGIFSKNINGWISLKSPPTILLYKDQNLVAIVKEKTISHSTNSNLSLVVNYDHPLINLIGQIENKNDILAWKNEKNELVRIELQDYKISFHRKNGHWYSESHSGFWIDEYAKCITLEPNSHYLILRNKRGRRIAIMPDLMMDYKNGQQDNIGIKSRIKGPQTRNKATNLLTYHVESSGKIETPTDARHIIYLIHLAMNKNDYKQALRMVVELNKFSEIDSNSLTFLDLNPKDRHPSAVSMRLRLKLAYKKFAALSTLKMPQKMIKQLADDYELYVNKRHLMHDAQLVEVEEKKVLSILQKWGIDEYSHSLRKIALQMNKGVVLIPEKKILPFPKNQEEELAIQSLNLQSQNNENENKFFTLDWLDEKLQNEMLKHLYQPAPIYLTLRPGAAFIKNFLYYYAIARHAQEHHPLRLQLGIFLNSMASNSEPKITALRLILLNTMKNPDKFPDLITLTGNKPIRTFFPDESIEPLLSIRSLPYPQQSFKSGKQYLEATKPILLSEKIKTEATIQPLNFVKEFLEGGFVKEVFKIEKEKKIDLEIQVLNDMEYFFQKNSSTEPCIQAENDRLLLGIKNTKNVLESKKKTPSYALNNSMLKIKNSLEIMVKNLDVSTKNIEDEILKIAHKTSLETILEVNGKMFNLLSIKSILVLYGLDDDQAICNSNPNLTVEDIKKLKELITEYLVKKTDQQHMLNMLNVLNDKNSSDENLLDLMTAERIFDPISKPHLLVFEYFAKLRLRKDQYDALEEMSTTSENLEIEARTGFGKSKVLIPLWLFLKSRQDKVAMMTVPASLFIAQQIHLKKILGDAFDLLVVPLRFDRTKANNINYLKRINKTLKEAYRDKKVLLTTIESLHGMTNLKIKEVFSQGDDESDTDLQNQLLLLREKITMQIADFFDESKVCFNIRHRYDYAVGNLSSIDNEQIELTSELYKNVILDKDITEKFNMEFLPEGESSTKSDLVQEQYEEKLLPILIEKIIIMLKIDKKWINIVEEDLKGDYNEKIEEFYKSLSKTSLETYARLKKQLTVHLRRTLYRKCDDNYGFAPGNRLANPFLDGVVKIGSEFSEVEDLLNFTIQANLKKPFKKEDIIKFIDILKFKAAQNGLDEMSHSPEYIFLNKLTKIGLQDINDEDQTTQDITDNINRNLQFKIDFIKFSVLPLIKIYKKKIASTSFNLIRAIHHVVAGSGTVNPSMLPPSIKTKEDSTAIIGNLMAFWKNSKERIFLLSEGSAAKKLQNLLSAQQEESVIIDVACIFRELDEIEIATEILKTRKGLKGVLLYNEDGQEMVYERETGNLVSREESLIPIEELFIFIRKSKAVGTDTDIPINAKAIVTIDKDTNRDFALQGAGRMRKLAKGQRVGFALNPSDAKHIFGKNKPNFPDLFAYLVNTQGKQKGEDAFYVLRLFIEDLIDAAFWNVKFTKLKDKQKLFSAMERFMVKATQTDPCSILRKKRKKIPTVEAIEELKMEMLKPLEIFIKENPEYSNIFDLKKMNEEFDDFVKKTTLPLNILMNEGDEEISTVEGNVTADNENIQENESEQINEMELEEENINENQSETQKIEFTPLKPICWEDNYSLFFKKSPSTSLLGVDVHYSPNFLKIATEDNKNRFFQKPAYQYVVQKEKSGKMSILLLDLYDAKMVLEQMRKQKANKEASFYLFSGDQLLDFEGDSQKIELSPALKIIVKIFSRSDFILKEEDKEYLQEFSINEQKSFVQYIQETLGQKWSHLNYILESIKNRIPN